MPSLILAAVVASIEMAIPSTSSAKSLVDSQGIHSDKPEELTARTNWETASSSGSNSLIAQFFYPSVSDRQGLMVQGQGEGSAPADTARIELAFTGNVTEPPPGKEPKPPAPLTEKSLQPIVNALVALGVPANAIEVNAGSSNSQPFPFPFPISEGGAQIVVKLDQPTRERVQQIVTVASDEKTLNNKLSTPSVSVSYAVNDCQSLEKAAYVAAVSDARNRARALSEALGVKIADIPSIAESPFSSLLSSSPLFGGSSSSCNSKANRSPSVFPFGGLKAPYDPAAPAEVRVKKDIFVTYTIR
jgi:hypothetical protein